MNEDLRKYVLLNGGIFITGCILLILNANNQGATISNSKLIGISLLMLGIIFPINAFFYIFGYLAPRTIKTAPVKKSSKLYSLDNIIPIAQWILILLVIGTVIFWISTLN